MTTTHAPAPFPRVALGLLLTLLAGAGLAWVALAAADGAVAITDIDYRTEFVDDRWWSAGLLLVVPVFLLSRTWGGLGVAVTAYLGAIQFVVAAVTVHRYQVSGWSDGLESFAYLEAFLFTAAFAAAAFLGWRRKKAR
ncbi:hypothetical protein [Cryptosporangium phraense]|uniref:Uncharacterized protein n=1 Tax=Cryptosporangium phraense TaxID=2593070 RepID=A0A545AM06_9ACTN|nr:hypothetical protein [Cryptosporangium phraense]TQS42300.1 hypothetical protein FL583_25580 [Cryptosporangium phraense]